jgi:hypothetical protein
MSNYDDCVLGHENPEHPCNQEELTNKEKFEEIMDNMADCEEKFVILAYIEELETFNKENKRRGEISGN